jgi:DnaJ-class molecular chaperone
MPQKTNKSTMHPKSPVLDELIAANRQIASRSAELKKSKDRLASAMEYARTVQSRIDRNRAEEDRHDRVDGVIKETQLADEPTTINSLGPNEEKCPDCKGSGDAPPTVSRGPAGKIIGRADMICARCQGAGRISSISARA